MDTSSLDPAVLLEDLVWVRRLAIRLVRDPGSADDLAQETWVRALERGPRGAGFTRAWLGTVLRNLVRERARRIERRMAREMRAARPDRVRSTDELAQEVELQGRLARLVLALDEPYRSTVLLRFVHGLEPAQIAARLGVPPATVRSRLKRALDSLRDRLDAEHGGDRTIWMQALAPWSLAAGGASQAAPATSLVLTGVLMKTWSWGMAALLAVALGIVWWTAAERPGTDGPIGPTRADGPAAAAQPTNALAASEPSSGQSRASVVAASTDVPTVVAIPPTVRGRVLDVDGQPVAGVEVFVGADQDPFPADSDLPQMGRDQFRGRTVTSASDGTFEAILARPGPVQVSVRLSAGWSASRKDPRARIELSVVAPAKELELVLVGNAWARLSVTVVDTAVDRPLEDFRASIQGESVGFASRRAEHGRLEFEVPLLTGGAESLELVVRSPVIDPEQRREVVLLPGEDREVAFAVQSEHVLRGHVLDRTGKPIEGATVFFGTLRQARGDEPFEPFTPRDAFGTSTDAEGRFELAGTGDVVSAWHPEHATATVPVVDAWSIVLGARETVSGIGAPGSALTWDEETSVAVVGGVFRIEHVDPGGHRLTLADGSDVGVRVQPGETLHVDLSRRLERVELGPGDAADAEVVLIGLGSAFSILEFRAEGPFVELQNVLPGRYHAWLTDGRQGEVEILSGSAELELGRGELTLLAPPGSRVVLCPTGADDLLATVAARVPARVGDSGRLSLANWPAGRWTVRLEPRGEPLDVLVADVPVEIDLR